MEERAYNQGLEAVRMKPPVSPTNPYDDCDEPEEHEAWERGAIDAGICDIYTNGVLNT
jgi:hypothetical protein